MPRWACCPCASATVRWPNWKQSQELDDALGRVVLSYKDALNGLSRAASSNYADIVRNVGQATLPTAGLAGEAAGLLQRAKAS